MNDKKFSKIRQKVVDALGMEILEIVDKPEATIETPPLVQLPAVSDVIMVDNPELPEVVGEMTRLEYCQRQTEFLLDHGLPAVQQSLSELAMMPPMYKGRAMEASAELFKAVADLIKHKSDLQLEILEMRMKMAAFLKGKPANNTVTGNTIIFNREELIRAYNTEPTEDTSWDK